MREAVIGKLLDGGVQRVHSEAPGCKSAMAMFTGATAPAILLGRLPSVMERCHNCGQELVEIDNRGERLIGSQYAVSTLQTYTKKSAHRSERPS